VLDIFIFGLELLQSVSDCFLDVLSIVLLLDLFAFVVSSLQISSDGLKLVVHTLLILLLQFSPDLVHHALANLVDDA
jgi:hypothetical protein